MATGGPIERQEFITDDALSAPAIMTKELEKLVDSMEKVRASAINASKEIASTESVKKLGDATVELTKDQEQYIKIQNQIATVQAKSNDQYYAAQAALKRVTDEQKAGLAASDQWVKQATAQNSSLLKLEDALNKNRIAYANLRTEQDRNGKSGKDLLDIIQKQDIGVKAIRDSMGQAQGHVGGYREEIEKLIPGLRAIAPEAVEAGEAVAGFGTKLLALIISPVAGILATVAAGFFIVKTALETFFERSTEGEDTATKAAGDWAAALEVVKDKFGALGKVISDTLGLQDHAVAGIISMALQMAGLGGLAADYLKKTVEEVALSDVIISLRQEELEIGKEIAEQEKRKNQDLFDSRDKLRKSDQDRFDAELDVRKAIEAEIALKLEQNDLEQQEARLQLQISDQNYEAKQKLADLETKRINIEAELTQGQRRSLQTLSTIIEESVKREQAGDKAIQDSAITTAETIFKYRVDANKRIVGNQLNGIDEQLQAEKNFIQAEIDLNDIAATKQIQAVRQQTFERVKLTSEEAQAIFDQSKGDLNKLTELTIAATNKKVELDKGYKEQSNAINQERVRKDKEIEQNAKAETTKIITDYYNYAIAEQKRFGKLELDQESINLSQRFKAGEISLRQFQIGKLNLEKAGAKLDFEVQEQGFEDELKELQKQYDQKLITQEQFILKSNEIEAKQSQARVNNEKRVDAEIEAARAKLNAALFRLGDELITAAATIGDNAYQAELDRVNDRIKLMQDEHDLNIKAAGDNAQAKLLIERKYNQEVAEEQKKVKKIQHDQAVYDRDIALAKVQFDTAKAIVSTLYLFATPATVAIGVALDAVISAIAIAQTAAILSKPIPAYFKGTDNHPGGAAIIGERGAEAVKAPGQPMRLFDVPGATIVNLPSGSKVYTAEETQAMVERNLFMEPFRNVPKQQNRQGYTQSWNSLDFDRVIEAVESNKIPDLVRQGVNIYRTMEDRHKNRRLINSKIGNFDEY